MRGTTRRELVAAATAGAFTAAVPPAWGSLLSRRARVGPGRFGDGVATGDPTPTAITFWSRLRTDRLRSGARLIVARDPDLRRVVATAVVPTGRAIDHALKARVGGLEPATEYHYAWESSSGVSPVGRTRTRPPRDSAEPLRIAFSSCQQYQSGYFTPHAHAAAEQLDLYLFLGDYIYERGRTPLPGDVRTDRTDAVDLASYRAKYALARADAGLQELHRLHPALHVLDDHEVENNYSDNLPPPSPLQRAAGYRAASEWIPRVVDRRDRYRIYRRVPINANAELFLLDARQYRSGSADGLPRRILGDTQMAWLLAGLKSSTARWKLIVQQVTVAANPFGAGPGSDAWDAFPEDRALLLGEIERSGVTDVVFLTGDAHIFSCNTLASDFEALGEGRVRPCAVEYIGGSVTSPGFVRAEADVRAESPWNRQYNGSAHGYSLLALDPAQLVAEYRHSDITVPTGGTALLERFTQASGANDVARESFAPPV
ncbi:MAG TPA: alkaline phosphatase D family protein [Solirubrobacteraceae bacterium]|jgi:phosphodiesterase/alkaline phosphatase D-like protein|nr:alkaline phosphatase D family protein [Solirubrobacteraceae bacterium]